MSSIKVTNLLQASSSTNNMVLTSGGDVQVTNNLQFNSGYGSAATAYGCRAWVNFDGTTASPSTRRGSGNVSSVTKGSTGGYTVNFTTAMVDANYSIVGGVGAQSYAATPEYGTTKTTTTCSVNTMMLLSISGDNRTPGDNANICIAIFR